MDIENTIINDVLRIAKETMDDKDIRIWKKTVEITLYDLYANYICLKKDISYHDFVVHAALIYNTVQKGKR